MRELFYAGREKGELELRWMRRFLRRPTHLTGSQKRQKPKRGGGSPRLQRQGGQGERTRGGGV